VSVLLATGVQHHLVCLIYCNLASFYDCHVPTFLVLYVYPVDLLCLSYSLQEFSTIWHAWLTMFNFMVSGFEFGIFYDCHNPEAAICLVVLYMFVVAVIFLNLLVGIMTDSWSKVRDLLASTAVKTLSDQCVTCHDCIREGHSSL